ncbi:ATP-binding cassette domain-containing protein [Clostridium minihomine]|uniref:ATP-binding cassette domain-containing protein n=1 Tax=Clostridium minihomine TaxID=2045012 RepID=UPI001FB24855|nr:ATP-binding cassette domain-containing protein [Clostridium minihomine]
MPNFCTESKTNKIRYISLSSLKNYTKGIFLDRKKEEEPIERQIKEIRIKVADKKLPILSLSAGNRQKVVMGKGILTAPKILLLDEPSRGIDVGAKTEVFDIINQYAERGLTILVISSELKEVLAVADRIVVLSNGKKTAELVGDKITEDNLVLAGHHTQDSGTERGECWYEKESNQSY